MHRNEKREKPPRRIDPIQRISSESQDGKQRIVIDLSSKTVTFIGCHKQTPSSFFTLNVSFPDEFVCPFADILNVHEYDARPHKPGGRGRLGPRRMATEITTAEGTARFLQLWSNYDGTRGVLTEISKSTPDAPWQRNPKIVNRLMFFTAGVITAIIIGLFIWLTER